MPNLEMVSRLNLPTAFPAFFPDALENFRRAIAESTDVPDEYAIAFMLAAGATAAGSDVAACVQPGWCVRANMFIAVVGHKGTGKSTLADKVFAPLVLREDELQRPPTTIEAVDCDYDNDDDDAWNEVDTPLGRDAGQHRACVTINDATGPAVLRLVCDNPRQLLVAPDELSGLFIRNSGGTDRQLWCELYDGRRRRQQRASAGGLSATLAAPYVCLFGSIQPDLLKCLHNARGDDGLVDRVLLVGTPQPRPATWPRDADDPLLSGAWRDSILRMFRIEKEATDAIGDQLESRFTAEAVSVCQRLLDRLNDLVVIIGIPDAQRGIVKKLLQHAVKLALLHRCFRWAAGEFGTPAAIGDVDAKDAEAACEATLFFLGRWLMWRPELGCVGSPHSDGHPALFSPPGSDPALNVLASTARDAHAGIRLIERLVRHLRGVGEATVALHTLRVQGPFANTDPSELHAACNWLVTERQGEWASESRDTFRLFPVVGSARKPHQPVGNATANITSGESR